MTKTSSIFKGNDALLLKKNLDFFYTAKILTGTHDPSLVATDAPKGSLFMRQTPGSGDGDVYKKLDNGLTTNWIRISQENFTELKNQPAIASNALISELKGSSSVIDMEIKRGLDTSIETYYATHRNHKTVGISSGGTEVNNTGVNLGVSFSWSAQQTIITSADWRSVAFSERLGMYVAVGASGSNRVAVHEGGVWSYFPSVAQNDWSKILWCEDFGGAGVGCFVALSQSTVSDPIMFSFDGKTWEAVAGAPNLTYTDAIYINNRVYATTAEGDIVVSSVGSASAAWTTINASVISLKCITYSQPLGMFLAFGDETAINFSVTSYDGATWVTNTSTPPNGYTITSVAWGNGRFLATTNISSGATLYESFDGFNWNAINPPEISVTTVHATYSEQSGVFGIVGGGSDIYIYDGTDVIALSGGAVSPDEICWGNGVYGFMCVGSGSRTTRVDSSRRLTYSSEERAHDTENIKFSTKAVNNGGVFCASTPDGIIVSGDNRQIPYSLNKGTSWQNATINATLVSPMSIRSIAYSPLIGVFVAIVNGFNTSLYSSDGITWNTGDPNIWTETGTITVGQHVYWCEAFSKFYTCGTDYTNTGLNYIYSSTDGISWNRSDYVFSGHFATTDFVWHEATQTLFFGNRATTTTGEIDGWVSASMTGLPLTSTMFFGSNGVTMCCSAAGELHLSADNGSTWAPISPSAPFIPSNIMYSPDLQTFFIQGTFGVVWWTKDFVDFYNSFYGKQIGFSASYHPDKGLMAKTNTSNFMILEGSNSQNIDFSFTIKSLGGYK